MPRPIIINNPGRLSLCLCPGLRVGAVLIAEGLRRRDDGCTPADRPERTSGVGGSREARVTDFHPHALRRAAQRVGRNLRQRGPTSGSDLGRRNLDGVAAIGLVANAGGVLGLAPVRIGRTGDAHAAPPAVLLPSPWRWVAMIPAESFRTKL